MGMCPQLKNLQKSNESYPDNSAIRIIRHSVSAPAEECCCWSSECSSSLGEERRGQVVFEGRTCILARFTTTNLSLRLTPTAISLGDPYPFLDYSR